MQKHNRWGISWLVLFIYSVSIRQIKSRAAAFLDPLERDLLETRAQFGEYSVCAL